MRSYPTVCAILVLAVGGQTARAESDPLQPVSGGLTATQAGTRAAASSYQVKAAEHLAEAAEERTGEARAAFVPRISAVARYTRLSDFTPPPLLNLGAQLVGTGSAPGTQNPAQTVAVGLENVVITPILDQFLVQATVIVPVSDYFLRIGRAYSAASRAEDAARADLLASRAKSAADGKIAYYTWLRARAAISVTQQALAMAKLHQQDADISFRSGGVSKVETMRAKTLVAAAELGVERANNALLVTERQLRIAIHADEVEKVEPGESLDGVLPPSRENLRPLFAEAQQKRPELKSIALSVEALRHQAGAVKAGGYPSLSLFGDVTDANPNPRSFPPTAVWLPTWGAGLQVTWTPTDLFGASSGSGEANARADALEAQLAAAREGIELEVYQAYTATLDADTAITMTARQLEAATEAYRAAHELSMAGRGTATTLTDAETALSQSRFESLNARVDARIARVRLDHAVGRDVRP